jgi:hypothetical protein
MVIRRKGKAVNKERRAHLLGRPEPPVGRDGQVGLHNIGLYHPMQQHLCHGSASSSTSCSWCAIAWARRLALDFQSRHYHIY